MRVDGGRGRERVFDRGSERQYWREGGIERER